MPINLIVREPRDKEFLVNVSNADNANTRSNLRALKIANGSLTAGLASAQIFAWQNPETVQVIVYEVIIYITTNAALAARLNVDVVANAATAGDTIFDGLALDTATCESSHDVTASVGANATELPHIMDANGGANDWVTGYEDGSQSSASLVGEYYIFYMEV